MKALFDKFKDSRHEGVKEAMFSQTTCCFPVNSIAESFLPFPRNIRVVPRYVETQLREACKLCYGGFTQRVIWPQRAMLMGSLCEGSCCTNVIVMLTAAELN